MKRTVRVKICGITREEDLNVAVKSGADAIGLIVGVPSSPRNLSLTRAKELREKVPAFVNCIIVMVPKTLEELLKAYDYVKPDAIQIHGDFIENPIVISEALNGVPLIRSINAGPIDTVQKVKNATRHYETILLDSYVPGKYGGTGIVQSWSTAKKVKEAIHPRPLILAGGLTPENVEDTVQVVKPYGVDVCSGVEASPSVKDHDKVRTFIEKAKIKVCDPLANYRRKMVLDESQLKTLVKVKNSE